MKLKDLVPMLETEDIEETVKFYTEKLGFKCTGKYADEENPFWVSLAKDEVVIMFSKQVNKKKDVAGSVFTGSLYLYPGDVRELWEHLKDKVEVSYPIEDFHYGMREFGIKDNNGYLLQFGQEFEHGGE